MTGTPEDLIHRHAGKALVIDTNLLVLLIIGSHDRGLIPRFKRTQKYTLTDFENLLALISWFRELLVTPHVWAETNSFIGQLSEPQRSVCMGTTVRELISQSKEHYVPSAELAGRSGYLRFGLTDAGIEQLAAEHLIVSDDLPLVGYLQKNGADVINFTHLRQWD